MHTLLGAVDLTQAVHLTPRQAGTISGNLMLTDSALKTQEAGGTWIKIFDPKTLVNQSQLAAVVIWYLAVLLLGWMVYPMVRLGLKNLPDRGFPVSRLVGLLLFAFFTWWASSSGIAFTRTLMIVILAGLFAANLVLAVVQRKELKEDWAKNKKLFLTVEIIMLVFFLVDLLIRYNNPDLWHPWRGGEKPMDLSYLTAVIKSTTFPPYDPWFAGGYVNYYYYGFVIVGTLVKLLGINIDVAYNLILPTLFGLTALGAFSIGWNIFSRDDHDESSCRSSTQKVPLECIWRRHQCFAAGLGIGQPWQFAYDLAGLAAIGCAEWRDRRRYGSSNTWHGRGKGSARCLPAQNCLTPTATGSGCLHVHCLATPSPNSPSLRLPMPTCTRI